MSGDMYPPAGVPHSRISGPRIIVALSLVACLASAYFVWQRPDPTSIAGFVTTLLAVATAIDNERKHRQELDSPLLPPSPDQLHAERTAMLRNVRYYWIDGVLSRSLQGAELQRLGLQLNTDAVHYPFKLLLNQYGLLEEFLPPGTPISSVFDRVGGALLILGEPGSGKTTTLLQLADFLLQRAIVDSEAPVPVVLNLSSWLLRVQTIPQWLIEELVKNYQVKREVARYWVEEAKVVLILDGLDEVAKESQDACIRAINAYRQNYGIHELAVASRSAAYLSSQEKLELHAAVVIQPLDSEQIDRYLKAGGDSLAGARVAVARDETLRRLVQYPLMLSIFAAAYRYLPVEKILESVGEDELKHRLYSMYIWRMLHWRGHQSYAFLHKMLVMLRWLAQEMQELSQSVFLLEDLQPQWLVTDCTAGLPHPAKSLPPKLMMPLYLTISRAAVGVAIGVTIAASLLAGSLATILLSGSTKFGLVGLEVGSVVGAGTFFGALMADTVRLRAERRRSQRPLNWLYIPLVMCTIGVTTAITVSPTANLSDTLILGLSNAFVSGLFLGLRDAAYPLMREIRTVERLSLSGRKALASLLPALLLGIAVGYLSGAFRMSLVGRLAGSYLIPIARFFRALLWGPMQMAPNLAVAMAAIVGAVGAVTFGVLGGLTGSTRSAGSQPNQGIRLSIRNAFFVGMLVTVSQGVLWGIVILWTSWYVPALIAAVVFGVLPGLLAALWHGGMDAIRHYSLRLVLVWHGVLPLNCIDCLDWAAENMLVRKVGGGYMFWHIDLLRHFAQLTDQELLTLAGDIAPIQERLGDPTSEAVTFPAN